MTERNLIADFLRNLVHLAQFEYPLLLLQSLLVDWKQSEIDSLAVLIVLEDLQNIQIKRNAELGGRPCACKHVSGNLRSVYIQNIIQSIDIAKRRGLLAFALECDEII